MTKRPQPALSERKPIRPPPGSVMSAAELPKLIERVYATLARAGARGSGLAPMTTEKKTIEKAMEQDIDRILARLDAEIPEAQKTMDALLARLRTTRIAVAA